MAKKKFYVTTPIYYVNDKPHIGHTYTSLICDIMARFYRLNDYDVRFITGTDEHGQKVAQSSELANKSPQEFCDELSFYFQDLTRVFNFSNDGFIRTTDDSHIKAVQYLWNKLIENDQIYLGKYEGWYSLREESFYTEDEIVVGADGSKVSPFGSPVEWFEQESYFFRLSNWQDKLLELYRGNPRFIAPQYRCNEVVAFVEGGLKDLSVSRANFSWGVPVPGDPKHVVYVWIDALANYLSAVGYPGEKYLDYWPADLHVMGKDIIRFHAVYWPALLMAVGIELPRKILAHGWWTVDGQKMSKSLGNVITPGYLVDKYGVDQSRYYLVREFVIGKDGNFCHESIKKFINAELANSIGNLFQRVVSMVHKNFDSKAPVLKDRDVILSEVLEFSSEYRDMMEKVDLHHTLDGLVNVSNKINKYVNDMAPWTKKDDIELMGNILRNAMEAIAILAIYLQPFMPASMERILDVLHVRAEDRKLVNLVSKDLLGYGIKIDQCEIIFPRVE